MKFLESNRVNARLRRSRGKDIDAACGQLANKDGFQINYGSCIIDDPDKVIFLFVLVHNNYQDELLQHLHSLYINCIIYF